MSPRSIEMALRVPPKAYGCAVSLNRTSGFQYATDWTAICTTLPTVVKIE